MSDFIGIDVSGLRELGPLLERIPGAVQDAVVEDVATYFVNVLRAYPPQKYVSRKQAYGTTFFSDKQRRWFFAALKDGSLQIPYHRTQTLAKGWRKVGAGSNLIIANETSYGDYVMGSGQSRHMAAIGWKTIDEIVNERTDRMGEIAEAAAKKGLRKVGME